MSKRVVGAALLIAVGALVVGTLMTATPEGLKTALILGTIGGVIATLIVLGIILASDK